MSFKLSWTIFGRALKITRFMTILRFQSKYKKIKNSKFRIFNKICLISQQIIFEKKSYFILPFLTVFNQFK